MDLVSKLVLMLKGKVGPTNIVQVRADVPDTFGGLKGGFFCN